MTSPLQQYVAAARRLVDRVAEQEDAIRQAADWFSASILAGRVVHLFGAGHSRIAVEEIWPRYGSFPGFNPIVELSLTYHNPVAGANGQRQAMFLETTSGLAERIVRNFGVDPRDSALVVSSSGCNTVSIEMAQQFQARSIRVVGLLSCEHLQASGSHHPDGMKLDSCVDLVLDTGAPEGDAAVTIPGLETPVAPMSSVGACLVANALKAEIAARLVEAGQPPPVLTAGCLVGAERSKALFEAAYDEHAHRMARVMAGAGRDLSHPSADDAP